MSIEFLSQLEDKIEMLLMTLEEYKDQNTILKQTSEQASSRISELEALNQSLQAQIDTLQSDANGAQEKINSAAERIQGLLAKLEVVQ